MSFRAMLADPTYLIEQECADRALHQRDVALTYALAMHDEREVPVDWVRANAAIVARWPKGLARVKKLAWARFIAMKSCPQSVAVCRVRSRLLALFLSLLSCASTGQRFLLDCSVPIGVDCMALAERDCPAGYEVVASAAMTRTSRAGAGFVATERRQIVVECREGR